MVSVKDAEYSTPAKRRRFVESERRRISDLARRVDDQAETHLEGVYGTRRQKAVLESLDMALSEFGDPGLDSVVETFTHYELFPFVSYDDLDEEGDLRLGAVLWILEKLRAGGKIREACRFLPDPDWEEDECFLPPDFYHPCFSDELIRSVLCLMNRRYPASGEYGRILAEEAARGKEPEEAWIKLLSLIPDKDKEAAGNAFRDRQRDILSRRMQVEAYFQKAESEIENQIRNLEFLSGSPLANPARRSSDTGNRKSSWPDQRELEILDLEDKLSDLSDQKETVTVRFSRYLTMTRKQIRNDSGSRECARIISDFTVSDPYELCFALIYLLDTGDDAPWLMSSGSALMKYVRGMLPWYEDQDDWDDEDWEDWYNGIPYDRNGWTEKDPPPEPLDYYHEKHGGKNLAQIIYSLCRSIVPTGLHPFEEDRLQLIGEGMPEATAGKIADTAELLFLNSFQASKFREDFWPEDFEEEAGPEEETDLQLDLHIKEDQAVPVRLGGYWGKIAEQQALSNQGPAADTPDQTKKLEEEVKALRKQVKSLHNAMAASRQEYERERAKYERELKSLRMEHRELADLRNLVFSLDREDPERREEPEEGFTYPYTTRKRTVVFGGHESFLKVIKPMLPSVRFVDAENLSFSPDIIRNADVVWIQNNRMGHSQFFSIVKQCKLAGVQMRYFGYASAEKCAEQLVKEDLEH